MSEQPAVPITQYASNSHASKAKAKAETDAKPSDKPEVKKVVSGTIVKRKPSLSRKFAETFIADDAQSVGSYIMLDVILPAVKDTISAAVSQGIERILFGENAVRGRGARGARPGFTNYSGSSVTGLRSGASPVGRAAGDTDGVRSLSRQAKAKHDFDELVFPDRADAEAVIIGLQDLIGKYQVATVSDLYDLAGVSAEFTDDKYGWYDDRGFGVQRYAGGFLLNLPKPSPLN